MRNKIIRLLDVLAATGDGRSTLYNKISKRIWTKPVRIGSRAVGWPESEVEQLNAARIAGKSDNEIRDLVGRLEADRKLVA